MIRKRILVTGANGLLGQRIVKFYKGNNSVMLKCISFSDMSVFDDVDYSQFDLTEKAGIKKAILDFFPDVIINCAAFTDVESAEKNKDYAWKLNVLAVENLIKYANVSDAKLVHISTDHIFDGTAGPYSEGDRVSPVNYYGRTKLAAENAILTSGIDHLIIRTNVVYGKTVDYRADFVTGVFDALSKEQEIKLADDHFNNPTFTDDITFAIDKLIAGKKTGIYNIAGDEVLSRYELGKKIAEYYYLNSDLIIPVSSKELPAKVAYPLKSGLITLKAESEIGYKPHTSEQAFHLIENYLFKHHIKV